MMTKDEGISMDKYFRVHETFGQRRKRTENEAKIDWIETPRTNTRTKRSQTWLIHKRSDNISKYRNWKIKNNSKKIIIPFTFPPAL